MYVRWSYAPWLTAVLKNQKVKGDAKSFFKGTSADGSSFISQHLGAATPLNAEICPALCSWLSSDTTGSDCNISPMARGLLPGLMREFYKLPWYGPDSTDFDDQKAFDNKCVEMTIAHVLGGSLAAPDGVVYHNDGYLCSGANFHSQVTAITTLGCVAAVESQIEHHEGRALSAADGCKLSYLLPQSTSENEYRTIPETLTHSIEDGVKVLNYNSEVVMAWWIWVTVGPHPW